METTRRQVADWAQRYLDGGLSFEGFFELLSEAQQDAEVAELVDLIEHEPQRGGFLGVSAAQHERHMQRIRELIRVLRDS